MPSCTPITARPFVPTLLLALTLASCSTPAASTPTATPAASNAASVDLSGIKSYLVGKAGELKVASAALKTISDHYYDTAKAAKFDYAALAKGKHDDLVTNISDAREVWKQASPLYEQMEGIVAGTPSLAQFDVNMDAGSSKADGGDNVVSYDLKLPNGQVLERPGNLFGVTESTLWGTFGDTVPDANVLKGSVDELAAQSAKLADSAAAWQPTEADAFTALVVMVPTMSEYFDSWKNSRFIAGDASSQRDFVAISRLADIQNILGSLQIVHQNVSPLIQRADATEDARIGKGLTDLKSFVADVYRKEQSGQRFNAEDADLLGKEAQDRATAITGQIAQVAAKLNIKIEE
jgi:hypothetical protein